MLRAGIIGAGRIGWAYDKGVWDGQRSVTHASCLERHPLTSLVALYDPVAEARAAFEDGYRGQSGVEVYDELGAFFDAGLDLVVIASPSEWHETHIAACLEQSTRRILIEKPVTLSLSAFSDIATRYAALATPPQVTVNYFRRFLPQTALLKAYVQKALAAGELSRVDITYSRGLSVNGVHMLDLLGHVFDARQAPALDFCHLNNDENPSFGFTMSGCPIGVLGARDLEYHGLDLRVTTQSGQMTLRHNGQELWNSEKAPNPDYPGFFHLDPPRPAMPVEKSRAAMRDGTYLALCELVAGTGLSPLDQSGFAQTLLEQVAGCIKARGAQ